MKVFTWKIAACLRVQKAQKVKEQNTDREREYNEKQRWTNGIALWS